MRHRITLDSSALPLSVYLPWIGDFDVEVALSSVTPREQATYQGRRVTLTPIAVDEREWPTATAGEPVLESAVLDESALGACVLAPDDTPDRLETILALIGNGSFPKPAQRGTLTPGQRRQLRDAMILEAHVRERRDIFVTCDVKAFGAPASVLRHTLEERLGTRILTPAELHSLLEQASGVPGSAS